MSQRISVVLVVALATGAVPALAQGTGFCASLRTAWTAGKVVPSSLGHYRIAGAQRCRFERNGDLLCTWVGDDERQGRSLYEKLADSAAACMAPLGLTRVRKTIDGVETTSLETPTDAPNVAVFYPGGDTVTISIVTSQ